MYAIATVAAAIGAALARPSLLLSWHHQERERNERVGNEREVASVQRHELCRQGGDDVLPFGLFILSLHVAFIFTSSRQREHHSLRVHRGAALRRLSTRKFRYPRNAPSRAVLHEEKGRDPRSQTV